MMYFALNTSAVRPVADQQDFFRLAMRFRTSQCCLGISTAGNTMTSRLTAAGTRDPLLQTALRLALNKLMTIRFCFSF
jgi:hypothetical protein